jgi:hypothetical protein
MPTTPAGQLKSIGWLTTQIGTHPIYGLPAVHGPNSKTYATRQGGVRDGKIYSKIENVLPQRIY